MLLALADALALVFTAGVGVLGSPALNGHLFIKGDNGAAHAGNANITAEQAKVIAEQHTNGTAISANLENGNGNLVYGVIVDAPDGRLDVKVDAMDGTVLDVFKDNGPDETNETNDSDSNATSDSGDDSEDSQGGESGSDKDNTQNTHEAKGDEEGEH